MTCLPKVLLRLVNPEALRSGGGLLLCLLAFRDTEQPNLTSQSQRVTPTWVLIVVALGSGLAGTYVRISHDRASELRSRMLEAADDYVRALDEARKQIDSTSSDQAAASIWRAHPSGSPRVDEAVAKADASRAAAHEATSRVSSLEPRIKLLFGPRSETTRHALAASEATSGMLSAVYDFLLFYPDYDAEENERDETDDDDVYRERRLHTDDERMRLVREVHERREESSSLTDDFSESARTAIAGRSWWPTLRTSPSSAA